MSSKTRPRALANLTRRLRVTLSSPLRRTQLSVLILLLLVLGGTIGYILLEDMGMVEALYMTVITITTVGFGEVKPLSNAGRLFTIGLIVFGVGAATSAISNAVEVVLGERLWFSVRQRRLEKLLLTMNNHYVVCGYGRMGQQIIRDLRARNESFVVIEAQPEMAALFLEENIPYVIGDATQDDVQLEAGIERARGFVAALDTDADNVLAVLTARGLNPDLFIVTRATHATTEKKLHRAGADRVVSPYDIGGHRVALALMRPAVHDFLNHIFDVTQMDMDIGEIHIRPGSPLAGQTLGTCDLRQVRNLTILAIQKPDGEFTINPGPERKIRPGETLIVIGPPESIYQIEAEHDDQTLPPEAGHT